MRSLSIILLLLIAGFSSQAQSDFREGYLLTTANDTIRGLLNKGLKENNSKFIQFKADEHAEVKEYSPNQLNAYQFRDDALYISRKVWNKDVYLGKVFMEALVTGSASLYAHQGDYYVTKSDSTEVKLKRVEKKSLAAGREVISIEYEGVGSLNYLLSDCSLLKKGLDQRRISEKTLTKHIVAYNECKGASYSETKKSMDRKAVTFGVGAGFNASSLRFSKNADTFPYLRNGSFSSFGPSVMASAYLTSPGLSEKLSFRIDMIYSSFNYAALVIKSWGYQGAYTEKNDIAIKLHTLSLPVSMQYTIKEGKLSPYLNFGASFNYHLSASNSLTRENTIGDKVTTTEFDAFDKSHTQFGLWAGFGINKMLTQKIPAFVELRLEGTTGVLPESYGAVHALTSNQGTAYLMTGIKF